MSHYESAVQRCPRCRRGTRVLADEVGMHGCSFCGWDPREDEWARETENGEGSPPQERHTMGNWRALLIAIDLSWRWVAGVLVGLAFARSWREGVAVLGLAVGLWLLHRAVNAGRRWAR